MIKPPSLTRETTWIWSGDDALDSPPEDAPVEARQAWEQRLKIARETGQWDGLFKAGQVPTRFTVRHVPGTQWRALMDSYAGGKVGPSTVTALSVRLALRGVQHLSDTEGKEYRVEFATVEGLGKVAKQDVIDLLDGYSPQIVVELSDFITERQSAPGPLSRRG